jgi:hypothetical protein
MLYIAFRVPIKEALLSGSSRERRTVYRALIYYFSKSPLNEPPPGSPVGPLWREMPQTSFHISFKVSH